MRVIALKAENFKRLKAVNISVDPSDPTVVVAGANAQGKTSVLDAIWAALGGAKASPADPIRHGQKQAEVALDLGDLKVTRRWKGGKTTLEVTNAAGGHLPSPQAVLDSLVGKLSFDPLQFALEKDPKKQLATLLDVVELPFDPIALAAQRKAAYDQRTDVNREVKRLQGALASLPQVPTNAPDEEVKVADLVDTLNAIRGGESELHRCSQEWSRIETEITRLRAQQVKIEEAGSKWRDWLAAQPAGTLVAQQIEQADETNAAVRLKRQRAEVEVALSVAEADSENLTIEIADIDERKVDGIAAARMPVEGLGFDDDGVTLNGVPFAQASAAEQLRTSTAIALAAMSSRPDGVRVILIRDGSLLDSKNLALITETAAAHDAQVWLEKVDESGEVGIVIEDGEVA